MTYDGTFVGMYGLLTSRAFRRVQECAIRSSGERVMTVQRHEEIKHHSLPRPCMDPTPMRARGAMFWCTTAWEFHAPTWATIMSPTLVYFKAHSRGFERGL